MPIRGHFRQPTRTTPAEASDPKAKPAKQPHILVVDDVQAIVEVVCEFLVSDGFTVESTTKATEALAWLTERPDAFAAIVSDLDMPYMSGTVLLVKARQSGFKGNIVIHSDSLSDADGGELQLLADAVVEKPFATRTLAATLRRLLK